MMYGVLSLLLFMNMFAAIVFGVVHVVVYLPCKQPLLYCTLCRMGARFVLWPWSISQHTTIDHMLSGTSTLQHQCRFGTMGLWAGRAKPFRARRFHSAPCLQHSRRPRCILLTAYLGFAISWTARPRCVGMPVCPARYYLLKALFCI